MTSCELTEGILKVAMEVLSILAFLLGSPLYIQRSADTSAYPLDPSSGRDLPVDKHSLLPAD